MKVASHLVSRLPKALVVVTFIHFFHCGPLKNLINKVLLLCFIHSVRSNSSRTMCLLHKKSGSTVTFKHIFTASSLHTEVLQQRLQ
uniref:Putative secreted protein n=1 Tax=Ixodes ricinus TaxID=34613 RepID=A0A6B0U0Y9_IXORI